jgi:membrane protein DedA with SNARE-associated domain
MRTFLAILSVTGLGAVFFWGAIPAGLAAKFPPVLIASLTALGGIIAVTLVVLLGRPLQTWILKKFPKQIEKMKNSKVHKIWDRYGVIGLGLVSPMVLGAPQCTLLGLLLGAKPGRMLFWASVGCILWAVILTVAGFFGVTGIQDLLKKH